MLTDSKSPCFLMHFGIGDIDFNDFSTKRRLWSLHDSIVLHPLIDIHCLLPVDWHPLTYIRWIIGAVRSQRRRPVRDMRTSAVRRQRRPAQGTLEWGGAMFVANAPLRIGSWKVRNDIFLFYWFLNLFKWFKWFLKLFKWFWIIFETF